MKPEEAFGLILKKFRTTKKISQEKLAFESNLDRTYISLLERGLRQPTLITIIQLSNALNTSPDELVRQVVHFLQDNEGVM